MNERQHEGHRESFANIPQHSTNVVDADQVYKLMTHLRNGLSLTSNPANFTNKIVPLQGPLLKLRQNRFQEVEVLCPLPIPQLNVLSPSTHDELRTKVTSHISKLPQCDRAFSTNDIAERAKGKTFICKSEDSSEVAKERESDDFEYGIYAEQFSPENHFAVNPMQVGKWFPGTYAVYP